MRTTILITLFLLSNNTHAYAVVWGMIEEVLKGIASGVTTAVVQDSLNQDDKQQLNAIQTQITETQTQIAEIKKNGNYPSAEALKKAENFINKSEEILKKLQDGEIENRIKILEQSLPALQQYATPAQAQAINTIIKPQFQITYSYSTQNQSKAKPLTEGANLKSGDSYKITFTPKQNSHVYILQVDANNEVFLLYPLKQAYGRNLNQTSQVSAGKTYFVPGENESFELDEQIGTEQIYFIASNQPDSLLENLPLKSRLENIKPQLLAGRGVGGIVTDPNATAQAIKMQENATISYLNQQQLIGYCENKGCIHILRFNHHPK